MSVELVALGVVEMGCMVICLWAMHPSFRGWVWIEYFFSNTSLMEYRHEITIAKIALSGFALTNVRLVWLVYKMERHIEVHKDDERVEKELKAC